MSYEEQIRAIARGDRMSFDQLYRSLRPSLLRYAAGLLCGDVAAAEDAVDEAFADIWRSAQNYHGAGSAEGWIRRIVRNKAVDWLRQRKETVMEPAMINDCLSNTTSPEPDPYEAAAASDEQSWLKLALARLNVEQREAVWLCYYEGLPLNRIAAIAGCPENTVKTRLFHARRFLRDALAVPAL